LAGDFADGWSGADLDGCDVIGREEAADCGVVLSGEEVSACGVDEQSDPSLDGVQCGAVDLSGVDGGELWFVAFQGDGDSPGADVGLPYQPDQYSYVQAALDDHQVVFNLDRIGVGQSDRPPADRVTVASEAYVTHQIVQALRHGQLDGTRFGRVVGVGHSMGSAIWMYEAAHDHDVDALVLMR
jgi:hypothetical protein